MGNLVRGAPIAAAIEADVRARAAALAAKGKPVALVAVRARADAASDLYLRRQAEAAGRLGLAYRVLDVAPDRASVLAALKKLGDDPETTGVIVQTPLPTGIDVDEIQAAIPAPKDVEGVHPLNLGRLLDRDPRIVPCTAGAVMECLRATGVDPTGAEAVVVGRSRIVGRPAALLLAERSATVALCHSRTRDLAAHFRRADLIVLAVGRPGLLRAVDVKPGAVVLDVGINRVERDGKTVTVGDAEPETAEIAAHFTPTPGGVGPVTVALLWRNAVAAAESAAG
jgi:methylenetetrahydrofolate dehydrogenase (NADP+)/methenyltetrahydrofolate cyclohydrolase